VVFNKPGQLFDVAVMMDCSQCPIHPTLKTVFTDYAKRMSRRPSGSRGIGKLPTGEPRSAKQNTTGRLPDTCPPETDGAGPAHTD